MPILERSNCITNRIIHRYQSIALFYLLFRFRLFRSHHFPIWLALVSAIYRLASFNQQRIDVDSHSNRTLFCFKFNCLVCRFEKKMGLNAGCWYRNSTDISHTEESIRIMYANTVSCLTHTQPYHKCSITMLLFWRKAYETRPAHLHGGWRMKALLN